MNRFIWNLRYPSAEMVKGAFIAARNVGPKAVPGVCQTRLSTSNWSQTQSFEVKKDPRLSTTPEDIRAQFDLAIQVRDKFTEVHRAISEIRNVRSQIDQISLRLEKNGTGADIIAAGKNLNMNFSAIEEKLMQTKNETQLDTCNFPPKLDSQFLLVLNLVLSADTRPTDGQYKRFEDLKAEWIVCQKELQEIFDKELTGFNELVRSKNIQAVSVPRKK
jgi:hypothetical protein